MKRFLSLFLGLSIFIVIPQIARADAPTQITGAQTVDYSKVIELIQKTDNFVIFDNRVAPDYQAGHIEGAIGLTDTDVTEENILSKHIKTKETPILFYCNGMKCGRAANTVNKAVSWGYKNIYYYAGGMEDWKNRNLPITH
jgi:rhodanese-related sulfurtransferase